MENNIVTLCKEWLDGTAKPNSCGYDLEGPNVQVTRPNGQQALLSLRPIAEALVNANKHPEETIEESSANSAEYAAHCRGVHADLMSRLKPTRPAATVFAKLINPNKHPYGTLHCAKCNKPMPQTAVPAASAICGDCSDKPWQKEVQESHDDWHRRLDEKRRQNPPAGHHITRNGCSICGTDAMNCEAIKSLKRTQNMEK